MKATATPAAVTTAVWPGHTPRLLRAQPGVEDLVTYTRGGGYRPLTHPDALIDEVEQSGLLGHGGAAFPLATKLRAVRSSGRETVVVANGEEGEPASIKDRWLMRNRPHLVLDGLRLAAAMVAADRAYVYVSDSLTAGRITEALEELGAGELSGLTVSVVTVDPSYVAGEETAAVRAINGGPAKPTDKPPRPFEEGVGGHPTLVSNVETLANLPYIQTHGAGSFRSVGTAKSPGALLVTVTGADRSPVLYEMPHGVPFTQILEIHGVPTDSLRGVLMGGYFAGLLNRDVLGATIDHETIRGMGSGLGCGAISLITSECPVAVAAAVMAYFDRENAGQCGSCFNGTAAMSAVTSALRDGVATSEDLARLQRWSVVLRGRGACGTLDGATNLAASLLTGFPELVARHLDDNCDICRAGAFSADRPYEVEAMPA